MEFNTCPKCKRKLAISRTTCPHCKTDLKPSQPVTSDKVESKPQEAEKTEPLKKAKLKRGLSTCPKCDGIIAKNVRKCPHCGHQFTSPTAKGCLWIIVLSTIVTIYTVNKDSTPEQLQQRKAEQAQEDKKKLARAQKQAKHNSIIENVDIKASWHLSGFGDIMKANLVLTNNNPFPIKDIKLFCITYGASGTVLNKISHTLYSTINAEYRQEFNEINLGFVNNQTANASCLIDSFTY